MAVTQEALAEALKAVLDPKPARISSAPALKNLQIHEGDVSRSTSSWATRPRARSPALRKALVAAAKTCRAWRTFGQHRDQGHQPRGAARRAADAQRQEHHRGGLGQGRRRQEHDRRQPGAGAGRRRRERRPARRRHLRPEPAHDDGHPRPSRERRRQDHGAAGEPRRAGHVDRLPGRPGRSHDLARPDGHPGAGAAAAPDQLEGPRLPDRRHAARHRRHPADAVAAGADDRRGDRHDAAGHRAARRARRASRCSRRSACRSWASSRTWRCTCARTAATSSTSSARAAASAWRPSTAWITSARCRWTSRSACRPTAASRPWWPIPTARWPASTRRVARQVAVKIASKAKDFSSKFPTIKISQGNLNA